MFGWKGGYLSFFWEQFKSLARQNGDWIERRMAVGIRTRGALEKRKLYRRIRKGLLMTFLAEKYSIHILVSRSGNDIEIVVLIFFHQLSRDLRKIFGRLSLCCVQFAYKLRT